MTLAMQPSPFACAFLQNQFCCQQRNQNLPEKRFRRSNKAQDFFQLRLNKSANFREDLKSTSIFLGQMVP